MQGLLLNSSGAFLAGAELVAAMRAAPSESVRSSSDSRGMSLEALEAIILRTTLATSFMAYLEGIAWSSITLQMLGRPQGTLLSEVRVCGDMMAHLVQCARADTITSGSRGTVAVRL